MIGPPFNAVAAAVLAGICAEAQQPAPVRSPARSEIVSEIKDLEKTLGFPQTGNFLKQSNTLEAYYRCYYTGKLELPASYEELELRQGSEACRTVDPRKYDVFFYPIEAVASGRAPVTSSLAESSIERLLVVVPHEDFHEHKQERKAPAAVSEAAATLAGFLAASEFARNRFGESSTVYRNLSREPELFLGKAEIVNRYHAELSRLYAAVRAGNVTARNALERKEKLFAQLRTDCAAIRPEPSSFNKCPGALNNAGLAFDMTYTSHYPQVYEIYLANNRDARRTIEALQRSLTPPLPF